MAKTTALPFLLGVFLFFSSCSPQITTTLSKKYDAIESTQAVKVYDLKEDVPSNSELLGEVSVGDTGFTSKCDYETVIAEASKEARKAGGNALKIISHKYPGLSTCHQIKASIYKVASFEAAPLSANTAIGGVQTAATPQPDTIQILKVSNRYKYMYHGEELSMEKFGVIIQDNARAMEEFKKGKGTAGFVSVLGYAGGFLIGYPVGTAIGGGKPVWAMAAVGCGLIVIAIPIAGSINHNVLKAAQAYNQGTPTSCVDSRYDIRFGMTQSGLGLSIRF